MDYIVLGTGRHGLEAVFDLLLPTHVLAVGGGRGPALRLLQEAVQHAARHLGGGAPGEGGVTGGGGGSRGRERSLILRLKQYKLIKFSYYGELILVDSRKLIKVRSGNF